MRRAVLSVLLSLALPLGAWAQTTVEAGGVKFDTTTEVAGQKLLLNGAGVRYRAIFKVYSVGFYLKAKADTPDGVIKQEGAKRVMLKMLRDVDGKELGKAFTDGMRKNAVADERAKTINGIFKFGEIFNDMKRANSGSTIGVDWIPGTGAQVVVDGKAVGEPIKEIEFYNALLRIWLGDQPADEDLKELLLGKEKRHSGRQR
ncbi:chalcone isomerase family protein [Inhella gelatinilytica]|uniref:Chalcone isomerase family protein n=1 Tax=Inhella gelatinilytica TaxID=2795030 RepID=A0A931NDX6_9BURK|nr:chalcone isomerase family protein [Inhella gelatinilytica]MBH9553562.1 chalcone isomerase family protein [Inhella gelatinilytica]